MAGRISSSSGNTGESTRNASLPERTMVQVVWNAREIATTTSACSPTARTAGALRRAEQLGRFEQRLHLGRGLLGPRLQLLLGAVDPDHRHLELQARLDVVVVARPDVHPALLGADAPLALLEVRRIGLVGAHLLRGDHEVEVGLEVPPREAQELVVDVGDQAGLELL